MKKRSLTAILLLSLLALNAAACGAEASPAEEKEAGSDAPVSEAVTEEEYNPYAERLKVSAGLPEGLDFGGMSFRTDVNEGDNGNPIPKDIYMENQTGDVVDDTIYARNMHVEELLNVRIEPSVVLSTGDAANYVRKAVSAGDDILDVHLSHMINTGGVALNGIFLNWYDVPYVDFKHEWYPQYSIKELTINDVMFLTMSDIMISSIHNTYCMYFNKDLAEDYDIGDVYSVVKDGKWTLDKMIELSKPLYKDLNGDGTQDVADQYGYATSIGSNVVTFFWSFRVPLIEASADGVKLVANNPKAVDTVSRLRDYFYSSGTVFITDVWTDFPKMFNAGQVLFIPRCVGETQTLFRETENYGIIPFPKYDEAQDAYYTMLDGCSPVMAVPKTASNLEMIGAVMEAMGEYSYKYLYPAYYDVALKVKGTRDETSIEMLDLIMEGRLVDFAFVYDNFKGFSFTLQDLLKKNATQDFASYYAKKEKSVQKHYDSVLKAFLEAND